MILITTVGRSGSSLLMRFLGECGIKTGTDRWYDSVNAGMEHKDAIRINEELINYLVKDMDVNLWHVYGQIEDLKLPVYKDPRILIHSDIIYHWWQVRQDIKIIFLTRDPQKIVESVYRVPEWSTPAFRTNAKMIQKKEAEFLDMVSSLSIPIQTHTFPFNNADTFISGIGQYFDLPADALDIWESILDGKEH